MKGTCFNSGICISFTLCILLLFIVPAGAYGSSAESLYTNGNNLIKSRNYTDAVAAFEGAVALEPSYFEAWNGKADALNRNGQYTAALQASDQALAINPLYKQGWINRGYILYNLGKYDDELIAYEKVIEIDPLDPDGWFNRGYALAAMGKYDEAIRSFDKVAEISPEYPNLAANRNIAEKNRDAATPFYIRYAGVIVMAALLITFIGIGIYNWRRKRKK
jgi:tetratricopeptide (TPR) repeat protein